MASLINTDLLKDGAPSLVKGVLNKLDYLEHTLRQEEGEKDWHLTVFNLIRLSDDLQKGLDIIKAYALAVMKDNWEYVPVEFRMKFSNSFYEFAHAATGGLSANTIDNRVSAARAYETFEVFGKIAVPQRDPDTNRIIMDGGIPKVDDVEWDLAVPSISKLEYCASLARSGELKDRPELLALLMDPGSTVGDIRHEIYGKPSNGDSPKPVIRYRVEGPILIAIL